MVRHNVQLLRSGSNALVQPNKSTLSMCSAFVSGLGQQHPTALLHQLRWSRISVPQPFNHQLQTFVDKVFHEPDWRVAGGVKRPQ